MNFVTKRSFLMKLIISIFLVIFIFNNICANYSYADFGGVLFKPICWFAGTILLAINGIIGIFLGGATDVKDAIMNQDGNWLDLLASPEHIFAGDYPILDANIFRSPSKEDFMLDGVRFIRSCKSIL